MYKIGIVGLGPAGILTLALLPETVYPSVIVFEPSAIGGDLATAYGSVIANIPKSVIVSAFQSVPRWSSATFPALDKYADDACPLLYDCVRTLRALIAPELAKVSYHSARVESYEALPSGWKIKTTQGTLFEVQKLVLATGATPRTLDLPKPTIPLAVAFSPSALAHVVSQEDKIAVFGTAHSGTLVLKNLRACGVCALTGLYKGEKPFQYARDGFSEGIKQESATIADSIVAEGWATLVPLDDFARAHRAVAEATAVVYAIGFQRSVVTYTESGVLKTATHDGTGFGTGVKNLYGFGIGFPAPYTGPDGRQYPDVGFGGFVSAIKAVLPSLLTFEP